MENLMKEMMKVWIHLKDFEFVIDVNMKQKTGMTQMDSRHIWTKYEEDEDDNIFCKFCDEKFANIPNMIMHKKIKHREKQIIVRTIMVVAVHLKTESAGFFIPETMKFLDVIFVNKHFLNKSQFMQHRKLYHAEKNENIIEQVGPMPESNSILKCILGPKSVG